MTEIAAFLVAPAVLVLLALGAGLLVAPLAPRGRLGAVTAPVGFAVITVVGTATTWFAATAAWTTGVLVTVAVAGGAVAASRWFRHRGDAPSARDIWAPVAFLVAFVCYAAPVALSGAVTWAGWVKLDDTASWLAFTDWLMEHGKTLPETVNSTYSRLIDVNFRGTGSAPYPTGAFPPLGAVADIVRIDPAWVIHAYMATLGGLLSLALYAMLDGLIARRWLRALAAAVAAQAATLFAYVMWGGLKEIILPVLLAVTAITAADAARRDSPLRAAALPIIGGVAFLAVTGTSGIGYIGPLTLAAVLVGWCARRPRSGAIASAAAGSIAVTGVVLYAAGAFSPRVRVFPEIPDIGNLVGPLNPGQAVGVWIAPDFRFATALPVLTWALILVAIALAVCGFIAAVSDRRWALPLFAGTSIFVVAFSQFSGGAWLAGKAMACASPAVLAAAFAGAGSLGRWAKGTQWRALAVAAGAAVAVGALVSNALAYHGVWLAPTQQQAELEALGSEFSGQGPALLTDFAVFGGRHFLRDLDAEVAADLRVNPIPLRDGSLGQKGQSFSVTDFPPSTVEAYPLLVLRRSPFDPLPPPGYELARAGDHYDVWRRVPGAPAVTADVPLSGAFATPTDASCAAIEALASTGSGGPLLAAPRAEVITVPLGGEDVPEGWSSDGAEALTTVPGGPGVLTRVVDVPGSGEYRMWLGGSFPGQLGIDIDGTSVYSGRSVINGDARATTGLATVMLEQGRHEITIRYDTPWWLPGSGAGPFVMGPIYLTPDARRAAIEVATADVAGLCSRDLDWVAAP